MNKCPGLNKPCVFENQLEPEQTICPNCKAQKEYGIPL